MKNILTFCISVVFCSTLSYSQSMFSVSTGIGLQGAQYGYRINSKLIPTISLQYIGASVSYNSDNFVFNGSEYVNDEISDETKANALIPSLGLKYFIQEKESIKSFISLAVSKPIIWASYEQDGEPDKDFEEDVKNIGLFGGQLAFGVEYFFNPQFSVGGMFGIRYLRAKQTFEREVDLYNPNTQETETRTENQETKINFSPTFSNISLNYYF
ncbi:MAG: hypothetical protein ACPF8V_02050 [Luteibaculum sp.]